MKIKLGGKNGGYAKVDAVDYKEIMTHSWHKNSQGYVKGTINGKNVLMHRYIINAPNNKQVDHINGDKSDNRRTNLRLVTNAENSQNKRKRKNASSIYRGVYSLKNTNKFRAEIGRDNKNISLGTFTNETDAAEAYDLYVVHNDMEFTELNFPEKREEYLKIEYTNPVKRTKSSNYIGVRKECGKFIVRINVNGKQKRGGSSLDEEVCARLYDKFIVDNNVLGKKLNFPDEHPNYQSIDRPIKTECVDVDEKTVKLLINKHEDKNILIDKNEYDNIKYYSCCINGGYVIIVIDGKNIKLHRHIMKQTNEKIFVDHVNGDTLNNTKENLRLSNAQLNSQNKSKMKGTSSKYIGVCLKHGKCWSWAGADNKQISMGCFHQEIHAARQRDLYIIKNHPNSHYKLNFEWTNKDVTKWRIILAHQINYHNTIASIASFIDANNFKHIRMFSSKINKYRQNMLEQLIEAGF